MYSTDEASFGLRGSTALGRAWRAKLGDHLPYGQLVLLAVATLCDQSALCTRDPEGVRAEVASMTGLEAWKVSEVVRLLMRDGHLLEDKGHLIVV